MKGLKNKVFCLKSELLFCCSVKMIKVIFEFYNHFQVDKTDAKCVNAKKKKKKKIRIFFMQK